jgi:hypothetical protein
METTILKRISPQKLAVMFNDHADKINIRYFNALTKEEINEHNDHNVFTFEVKVRHNENENPNKLFNNVLKIINQPKRNIVKTNNNNVFKHTSLRKQERISLGLTRQELFRKIGTNDLTVIDQYVIPLYNEQTNSVYFVTETSYSSDERAIIL